MSGGTGLRRFVGRGPAGTVDGPAPATTAGPAVAAGARWDGRAGGDRLRPGFAAGQEQETCEMCATAIPADHGHVANLEQATLLCACRACCLLFTHSQAGRGRYRAVPDRYLAAPGRQPSVAEWDQLQVPVGLAFFLRSSLTGELAGFYPSPAGATECRLDLDIWRQLAESYPLLRAAADDVEAILVSRGDCGVECFLVPIDACYELAGRMRMLWRGFDGGPQARASITEFLDGVRSRARPLRPEG